MRGVRERWTTLCRGLVLAVVLAAGLILLGCAPGPADDETVLTIYSGRNEHLVAPILEAFEAETGIRVQVRYASTGEHAATLEEEGENSPADLFFAQDAGALGKLQAAGLLRALPDDILEQVDPRFRSTTGEWVGVTGRARVVVYNTERVNPEELPSSILGFTAPQWQGRIGWPPTNASFLSFVTALRLIEGEEGARAWLEGILANSPREYPNNTTTVEGVAAGEVDVGFVNHYYLYGLKAEHGEGFTAENHFFTGGDVGGLINVAGIAITVGSENAEAAEELIRFLLSEEGQQYFVDETFEYPLVTGMEAWEELPSLEEIDTPDIDLSDLDDLERTLELLEDVGAL